MTSKRGFTLVEILVVLGVLVILAAFLFPVLSRVREKGRQASCISNLRQLGVAISLYSQDYDGLYSYGGDPTDTNTTLWANAHDGEFQYEAQMLPPLTFVLKPYVKNTQVWHCPSDTGFDTVDSRSAVLNARPTCFAAFGMSYFYRTELSLRRKKNLVAYQNYPPYTEYGADQINMLFDAHGSWHGGNEDKDKRYNTLMADGHVKNLTFAQLNHLWTLVLNHPLHSSY